MCATTSNDSFQGVPASLVWRRHSRQKDKIPAVSSPDDIDSNPEKTPSIEKNLVSLPPEIHHIIASHLPYPDLLSLSLTTQYFSVIITPKLTVKLRVDWVQSRYAAYLPVPQATRLSFISDALFVRNVEVSSILRRRRKHAECIEYDEESQRLFRKSIMALEVGGRGGMQYLKVSGRVGPRWNKNCLVTGERMCPRILEKELVQKRYERSVVGRVCSSWRLVSWAGWTFYWWLRSGIRSIRRRRRGGSVRRV